MQRDSRLWQDSTAVTPIFDGDPNECSRWVGFAMTKLKFMLGVRPGPSSETLTPVDGVEIRIDARPNRIRIKAGGENGYVTYPDILGATGDVDNFGYATRIVHQKGPTYVKKTAFYAGSNRIIHKIKLGITGTGGDTFLYGKGAISYDDFTRGYTVSKSGKNVVSWYDNSIYIQGLKSTLYASSYATKKIIGAAYNGSTLAVMRVNPSDQANGGRANSEYQGWTRIDIDTYSVAVSGSSLTVALIGTYALFDDANRVAVYPVFLDETLVYLYDDYNLATYVGVGDSNGYGRQYALDSALSVASMTPLYTDFLFPGTSGAFTGRPDYIFCYKGAYIFSFMDWEGAEFLTATFYAKNRLSALKNGALTSVGTDFVDAVHSTTFYTQACGSQYVFANEKLNLYAYLVYQPKLLTGTGFPPGGTAVYETALGIKLNGVITVIPDTFTAGHSALTLKKSTHVAFDGKMLVICFLDYSIVVDCAKSPLSYVKLAYRLDGVDMLSGAEPDNIDITPLSVTECYSFTEPKLTYS